MATVASDPIKPMSRASMIYVVGLLTVVNAFNYMDRMVLAVLAEPIKRELGLTDSQLGLLTGFAFVAVYAAVGLPLARLADRIGRRWVLAGALAVWSVMTALSGSAHSFLQLALARMGVGVGEAGGMPTSHALLSDIFPPHRRAVPIAVMTAGASIGISGGLMLGGAVAGVYGWRAAFVAVGLPGLLLVLLVVTTLPEPARPKRAADAPPRLTLVPAIRDLFRISTYRWLVMAHPFYSFVTAGLISWLPPFFMRSHGMSVKLVGMFFGIAFGFGMVLGGIAGAWILQAVTRSSVSRMLRYAGWMMLAAFPLFAASVLVSNQWLALGLISLFGALSGGAGAPMIAGQQGVVGRETRALGSALSVFFSAYLGAGLGPLLVGMGSDWLTPSLGAGALRAALAVATLAVIPGGLFMILASRTYDRDARD